MKHFGFIFFICGVFSFGCIDTEGILEIEGKVIDEKTKIAIPNRRINVLALFESDGKFIASQAGYFSTSGSGYFKYSLNRVKNAYYYDFCIIGDSSYAFSKNRLGLIQLYRNNKYLTFNLCELTDLAIKIERKSKIPYCDTLYISWKSNGIDGESLYPFKIENYWYDSNINKIEFIGGEIKPIVRTKVHADYRTIVHYKLFREGKYVGIYDTIFCKRDVKNVLYFQY